MSHPPVRAPPGTGGRQVARDGAHMLVPDVPARLSRAIRAVLD
jgi:hypothetical protein